MPSLPYELIASKRTKKSVDRTLLRPNKGENEPASRSEEKLMCFPLMAEEEEG